MVGRSSVELTAFLDDWLVSQRSRLKDTTWASYEVAVARIKRGNGKSKLQGDVDAGQLAVVHMITTIVFDTSRWADASLPYSCYVTEVAVQLPCAIGAGVGVAGVPDAP